MSDRHGKPINPNLPHMWHGGDYNPEQWTPDVWDEDVHLMQRAHATVATMGMFAWARLEPEEGKFDFAWLDDVIERLTKGDRWFILGTPSAAPPAWLSIAYPETLRTGVDRVRRGHGNRVNFNWASAVYREKTREIARRMAERYGSHPRLLAWHMSNEYGGEDFGPESVAAFRQWLRAKFRDDLDALNHAYCTAFWGHTFRKWDEIDPPGAPYGETAIQGLTVDWMRFSTEIAVSFMLNEAAPLRELSPHVPITTNMMGAYPGLDYRQFASHLDFISWDSYPAETTTHEDPAMWWPLGFKHDLMRSLKPDKPWLLMEFTPSSANWYPVMTLKRPGMHRFEGLHAVSHGSDGLLYFQWRQSRGGQEQYHGAVVCHGGIEKSRVFREVCAVGQEIAGMPEVVGSTVKADVALLYDWENRWALDAACGPIRGDKRYEQTCIEHHRALTSAGYMVDLVGMDDDLERYKMLVAPMAFSVRPGFAERVSRFVERGGTFLTTYLSGWVDENSLVYRDGLLTPFRDLLGVSSEEMDALPAGRQNTIDLTSGAGLSLAGQFVVQDFCELVHADAGVTTLGVFADDFYAGRPALTDRPVGKGHACYLAARVESGCNDQLLPALAKRAGARRGVDVDLPPGVLARVRSHKDRDFVFLFNMGANAVTVRGLEGGDVDLPSFGTKMLIQKPQPSGEPK